MPDSSSEARIAYLSFDRFPSPKGAATHIDAFVRALGARYGGVDLITVPPVPESPEGPLPTWSAPGVRHVPQPADGAHLIERVLHFRTHMQQWLGARLARRRRPLDVIHVRSVYEGYPLARRKAECCRYLIYEVNGLPSIELKYHYPRVAEDRELLDKLRHQEQVCLEQADRVLTVSQVNARHLVSRGVPEDRIRVIPNGVDLECFRDRPESVGDGPPRADAPHNRGLPVPAEPQTPLRLLYCGGLAAWQGVQFALEALALYRRDFPAQLKIVGPARPRQRKPLENLAFELGVWEHVEFHHPVPRDELAQLHHQADAILAPLTRNDRNTTQGCCPLKVLEAMACGVPLVASDLEVVRELCTSDREALLVRPGSGKAIKDALLRLREDPRLGPRIARAARRRVEAEFTWTCAQQRLLAAYEELLAVEPAAA